MDKETCERIAKELAQVLVNHGMITERQKSGVRMLINMELDKEFIKPLEEFNRKQFEKASVV